MKKITKVPKFGSISPFYSWTIFTMILTIKKPKLGSKLIYLANRLIIFFHKNYLFFDKLKNNAIVNSILIIKRFKGLIIIIIYKNNGKLLFFPYIIFSYHSIYFYNIFNIFHKKFS